jgi:hypothetical protein
MRKLRLVVLTLPGAIGCLAAEETPVRAPAAAEPQAGAERVVVSSLIMVGSGTDIGGEREGPRHEVAPATSDAEHLPSEPVFFHLGAGYAAIGHVDIAPCRDRGLDPGYVHMRVTFGGGGTVVRATVESPTQPSPEALACISERLAGAWVPMFQGDDVTLSKSAFIAPDNRVQERFVNGNATSPGGTL